MDHNLKRYVYPNVHSSAIYNSQDLDTTQVSLLVLKVKTLTVWGKDDWKVFLVERAHIEQ